MKDNHAERHKYDDFINLPRHRSKTRQPMSLHDRAAQFSPFAALTGHEAAIKETARLTEEKITLTEGMKAELNARILLLKEFLKEQPEIAITYFLPDERKQGGAYHTEIGTIKKVNSYEGVLIMQNNVSIPIDAILALEGELFAEFDGY